MTLRIAILASIALTTAATGAPRLAPAPDARVTAAALQMHVGGRAVQRDGNAVRQWPGTYFEAAFRGSAALLKVGTGDVRLHVLVDGVAVGDLVKPAPGLYRVDGLAPGRHVVRVEVASESQSAPTQFGGLYPADGARALPPPSPRARRIEFIGDSHTVGYGNTATKRDCTESEVWQTTDTSRGIAGLLGRQYDADYAVNAISGRGVVRNYDGFAADTLPIAYPFALFDRSVRAAPAGWHPQVIVIALGTNDFSTPLKAGEPWPDLAALDAAYVRRYVAFVRELRRANPRAQIVLWATDLADGEILREAGKVVAKLRSAGDRRVGLVPVTGLAFSGCHAHPSIGDDKRIAAAIDAYLAAQPAVWRR
ncbi:SGNH/GDSL hydrolase family protein [Sphingomonas mollis]|uniref:GDSL family lipase n=1 Tax=Sphingomonas mollis TaxID=2795726 RepID=A0ABS0XQG8_9SPHN|nr:SGNH/GDSL hydrolase family protein [Sphingomonas sp. BT553]MBJ6121983.1 GDSL family lipase [Sphingomonas sp. BT553]